MGAIYKVHHNLLDEIRVIKFMRAAVTGDPDLHRRFLQEAKLVTRFKHANIAAVYDFALDDDGTAYIVMEYVDGMNLSDVAAALKPLPLPLVLEVMRQTLDALAYLHRKQVVHRDISPDNVMLTLEDDHPTVKLIDLGIAKALDSETGITKTGLFLGKLKYASPEQLGTLQGDERLDGRSDLYSLGVVMYELLTGRLPFAGTSAQSLIAGHLIEAPASFDVSDPAGRVPLDVRNIVMKTLSKNRHDRFAAADEMRDAIQLVQQQQHAGPREIDVTALRDLIAVQQEAAAAAEAATPSAQERMNRQFGFAATTPPPVTPASIATMAATKATREPRPPLAATVAIEAEEAVPLSARKGVPKAWLGASAVAAAALLVIAGVMLRRDDPLPVTPAQADPIVTSSQIATPVVPVTETVLPTATETASATDTATPVTTTTSPPPSVVATTTMRPVDSRPRPPATTTDPGTRVVSRPPPPQISTTTQERPAPRDPEPVVVTRPVMTATTAEVVPPPPAVEERPAGSTRAAAAEDEIRDTIAAYVAAQEALDADRYIRVFPSADKARVTSAFKSFRSQDLDLTIDRIDVNGSRATVRAQETRTAVPRAGTVQRVSAERSFTLERRGSDWVIVGIR